MRPHVDRLLCRHHWQVRRPRIYAKVVSARQSGTLINDLPLCMVRLVHVQAPARQRGICQPVAPINLPAIETGCMAALRVGRSSGRALIDFPRS